MSNSEIAWQFVNDKRWDERIIGYGGRETVEWKLITEQPHTALVVLTIGRLMDSLKTGWITAADLQNAGLKPALVTKTLAFLRKMTQPTFGPHVQHTQIGRTRNYRVITI